MNLERLDPRPDNSCFGCGGANPRGLKLAFELDRERRRVLGRFRLPREYGGASGMLHGGIIALLLDEAMGKLNRLHDVRAVTAELDVRFLRPVPTDAEICVEAEEVARQGRSLEHCAEIRDPSGAVLARARARFVVVPPTTPSP